MKPTPKLKMKLILNTKAGYQFSQSECFILSTKLRSILNVKIANPTR